jgi:hypothetical protein
MYLQFIRGVSLNGLRRSVLGTDIVGSAKTPSRPRISKRKTVYYDHFRVIYSMNNGIRKKVLLKEQLEQECKVSHSFCELQKRLGYTSKEGSYSVSKRIKNHLLLYNIDFSHFDRHFASKARRIHPIIKKECPICHKKFKESEGCSKEKTYCSRKCGNALSLGNRRSPETNLKVSLSLKRRVHWQEDDSGQLNFEKRLFSKYKIIIKKNTVVYEKECEYCHNIFYTKRERKMFCGRNCQMKGLWQRDTYRNKLISKIRENVKTGKHQGWKTRNILSYPEKFFKKVLELNGFKDRFITNYPIKKSELGLVCDACYFLDFYFPEFKLDLEIDGKQHSYEDRMISDKNRDESLTKNGYQVYRIKWKSLNKPEGKEFIRKEIEKFLEFIKNYCGRQVISEPVS